RLARNGRDWHTLLEFCALEFCALVGSLIIDEAGIYDPRLVNDRLLLGMKGTFSELELSTLRQRSQEALRLKAARGELHTTVAIGYRRGADDRLEQDPDRRIREALSLVFHKFREIGSVRQLVLWLGQEGIDLPTAVHGPQGWTVRWGAPRYHAPSAADQSGLCWCLCLWPHRHAHARRRRPQSRHPRCRAPT
ncbi:recombinase family protein, partial [Mesorhizobium sp. M0323]